MRAITIRNPYAFVIAETAALAALGVQPKVENRGRPVADKHLGHDFAIHAGQTWDKAGQRDPRVRRAWKTFADAIGCCRKEPHPALATIGDLRSGCVGHGPNGPYPEDVGMWMDTGVVAVARLVDCHPAAYGGAPDKTCCEPWGDAFYNGGPCFHLGFDNVRRLRRRVRASGKLALPWTLPDDAAAQVLAQLPDPEVAHA